MTQRRVALMAGRVLVGFGLMVFAFTAYQLWGTRFFESSAQAILKQQFRHALARDRALAQQRTHPGSPTVANSSPTQPANLAPPPPSGTSVAMLQIPSIGLDKAIVQGVAEQDLARGPGHYPGTPMPGQAGNAAIAGHRTTFGGPFYRLNYLHRGSVVLVTTAAGSFRYVVIRTFSVLPTDGSVIAPTKSNILTLTTCTPLFSAAERLIVQARLDGRASTAPPWPTGAAAAGSPSPGGAVAPQGLPQSPGAEITTLGGLLDKPTWLPPLAWGLLLIAFLAVVNLGAKRGRALLVWASATPFIVANTLIFFAAITPPLPASY